MSKLNLIFYNILLFVTFILFSEGHAQTTIVGLAKVIDGDTIIINKTKIRFGGIDAPESYFKGKTQTCFMIASNEEFLCGKKSKIVFDSLKAASSKKNNYDVKFKKKTDFFIPFYNSYNK